MLVVLGLAFTIGYVNIIGRYQAEQEQHPVPGPGTIVFLLLDFAIENMPLALNGM